MPDHATGHPATPRTKAPAAPRLRVDADDHRVPDAKPPTRTASGGGSPGTVTSTSTPAACPQPPQAHAAGARRSAVGHLAVDAIAVASLFPRNGVPPAGAGHQE
jgi:hypothetical protein